MFSRKLNIGLKTAVVFVWVFLFAALIQRDYLVEVLEVRQEDVLARSRQESFSGVYFKGERIGYVKNVMVPDEAGDILVRQQALLNLTIMHQLHPVRLDLTATLTPAYLLKDFSFSFTSPFYRMDARGRGEGRRVTFTLMTGKEKIEDSIVLAEPPILPVNRRAYLLNRNLEPGDKVRIAYFDPFSLSGKDTVVEYMGQEKTLIRGRVSLLHHFVERFAGMRVNSWLDDSGKVVKEESPAGFVFVAEPEFRATDIVGRGKDLLETVSIPFSGDPATLTAGRVLRLRLAIPGEGEFDLQGGRQEWRNGVVTIRRETLPSGETEPCPAGRNDLDATAYVQADNPRIVSLGKRLTEEIIAPLAKVRVLAAWVYDNLEKRPVIGIPDAVTTLKTGRGDCNEHAVLFAALARSVGIPTRIAAGVTFHEGAFFYHAWNEVCLDGNWISLDTTKNQIPADLSHIRFVIGETREQIRIGGLLGNLRIEALPEEDEVAYGEEE